MKLGGIRHDCLTFRMLGYREVQVLEYVKRTIAEEGSAPSYEMIRDGLDLCDKAQVCKIVRNLEKRGLLNRAGAGRVRRIRLPA